MYPFIDDDESLFREDLVADAFRAVEIDSKLYRLFPFFSINTIVGSPAVLGKDPGWTVNELIEVINANPQADIPMGQWGSREEFLDAIISQNLEEYIDWDSGNAHFNKSEFIDLMEFIRLFPTDAELHSGHNGMFPDWVQAISEGRQILMVTRVGLRSFREVQNYISVFGGEVVYKGFPSENREGNSIFTNYSLAMTTTSSDKHGAWSFLRMFLNEEWQREYQDDNGSFPTNQVVFNELLSEAMSDLELRDGSTSTIPRNPLSQYEADQILDLLASAIIASYRSEPLANIIREGVFDYLQGRTSAEDSARVIQSRVQIYLDER